MDKELSDLHIQYIKGVGPARAKLFSRLGIKTVFDALHHLPEPEPILKEIVRVLNNDGLFVLADFTQEGFQIINRVHGLEEKDHNRFPHSIEDAVKQLTSFGLVLISQEQDYQEKVAVLRKIPYSP